MRPHVLAVLAAAALIAGCRTLIVNQRDARSLLGARGFQWVETRTAHFRIYFEAGGPAEARLETIREDAERSLARVLEVLDVPGYERRIHLFVLASRARMHNLIGRETGATAFVATHVVCIVTGVSATHELLHVVAMNLWGVSERWVNEGLAVHAGGRWQGRDLHAACHALELGGELPDIATLTGSFEDLPEHVSYPAAGSFVRYLAEAHGPAAVRRVWDGGAAALTAATGMNLWELEKAWRRTIGVPVPDG